MFPPFLALSPSMARFTASMLLRLHADAASVAATRTHRVLAVFALMAAPGSLREARARRPLLTSAESLARVEDDRVDDRDHAALGLRKRQVPEPAHDALHDRRIGDVAAAVGCHRHRPLRSMTNLTVTRPCRLG